MAALGICSQSESFTLVPHPHTAIICRHITAKKNGVKKRSCRKPERKERKVWREREKDRAEKQIRGERTRGVKKRCYSSI